MGLFDRFRRNRQQSVLPDEVKEYYQTERRQRRGTAALLAVAALAATIAVAAGLFFAGRFVYNQIRGDDSATTQTAGDKDNSNKPGNEEQQPKQPEGSNNPNPTPPPVSTPGSAEPQTPAPTPPAPAPTTPALGDSPLPRTGDEGM